MRDEQIEEIKNLQSSNFEIFEKLQEAISGFEFPSTKMQTTNSITVSTNEQFLRVKKSIFLY